MIRTELIAPVSELICRHAKDSPARLAFRDNRMQVTYGELAITTANLAGHLQDAGIEIGDSVAIFLPNSVQWIESCFATLRAGGVSVPISYESTVHEVAYRLEDAQCKVLITTDARHEMVTSLLASQPQLTHIILVDRALSPAQGVRFSALRHQQAQSVARDPCSIDETSFIIYTSGTTGRPKGVLLTQRGMLWITAACWAPIAQLSENDYVLSPLPLFHSYALNFSVLSILSVGASEYLIEKFSTTEVMQQLQSGQFTVFPGVPTMFHYLLEAARNQPDCQFPNLRVCISAGAIMPAAVNLEFEQRFDVKLLDGYGITETSTMVTMNWMHGSRVMGSCGLALPGLSVRLIDPVSGKDVQTGQEGELIVRGPNVMLGYHRKPAETESVLRDGWYFTGDLAKSDLNGFLTITGRLKELVIRGGQNIAPAELEEVVCAHAAVLDCAVVGAPHAYLGEVPVVFVVLRAEMCLTPEVLLEHCRERLSAYKVPAEVYFISEIPRTGSGKIIRFKLKETLVDHRG